MALVKTLDKYDLQREFAKVDRDYYSLEGYEAILELFEETDNGQNTDLDVVAICCEFNESTPADIIGEYDNIEEIANCQEGDEINTESLLDALNYYTWAIDLDNGNILYINF